MPRDLPTATSATVLLGKVLIGVGVAYGAVLVALPLQGPDWPRVAMGGAVATWGLVAWRRAAADRADAPVLAAAGLAATGWSYYLIVPSLGTEVTGAALLLPILACLPILRPSGVALVGIGSIAVELVARAVDGVGPSTPNTPYFTASLIVATALGVVVARLHEQYVLEVATVRTHERELQLRHDLDAQRADFLRRFINSVSHEIATPLTPLVIGLTSDAPGTQAVQRMRRNAERLEHIARGLGAIAGIEEMPPDRLRLIPVRPVVAPAVEAAGWTLAGDAAVWADEDLLRALFSELLDNQQRHVPDADVVLTLDDGLLRIAQTPPGVPPGTRLGQPFARHHATSRGGLGLYTLARRLERIGGSLRVTADSALVHEVRFPGQPS